VQNSNFKVAAAFLSQSENAALWDRFASNTELKSEHPWGAGQLHKPSSFIYILAPDGCGSKPQLVACTWLARPYHPLHFNCQTEHFASLPMAFYLCWKGQSCGKNLALHLYKLMCAHNHLIQGAETLGKASNVYRPRDKNVRFGSTAAWSARSWWGGHTQVAIDKD